MAPSHPSTDTASIQNQIAEPLRRIIEPLVREPATVFDDQIRNLETMLAKADELPKASVQSVRDSLQSMQDARARANAEQLDRVRANIAAAIIGAVQAVDKRIPLAIRHAPEANKPVAATATAKPATGRRKRTSTAEVEAAARKILSVLPPSNTSDLNCKSKSEIMEETGLDGDLLNSALAKLKRDEAAETNGQRGPGGGWRRASRS